MISDYDPGIDASELLYLSLIFYTTHDTSTSHMCAFLITTHPHNNYNTYVHRHTHSETRSRRSVSYALDLNGSNNAN